ncbi:MAG: hypothetical protein WA663_09410 [Candidatus Acidiferrales bacterium]
MSVRQFFAFLPSTPPVLLRVERQLLLTSLELEAFLFPRVLRVGFWMLEARSWMLEDRRDVPASICRVCDCVSMETEILSRHGGQASRCVAFQKAERATLRDATLREAGGPAFAAETASARQGASNKKRQMLASNR